MKARNAQMVEMLASRTVVDSVASDEEPADPKVPIVVAIDHTTSFLNANEGQKGHVFPALARRETRLRAPLDTAPRPVANAKSNAVATCIVPSSSSGVSVPLKNDVTSTESSMSLHNGGFKGSTNTW